MPKEATLTSNCEPLHKTGPMDLRISRAGPVIKITTMDGDQIAAEQIISVAGVPALIQALREVSRG